MLPENATIQTPELTAEERSLVVETIDGLMGAHDVEGAIANALRSKRDGAGHRRRMGETTGAVVQQLYFWDHAEGELEDDFVHKAVSELALETRKTEARVRTALDIAEAEGLLECKKVIRPSDRRPVWAYRVNVWEMFRVAFRSEIETTDQRLERERRPKRRAALEARRETLQRVLDDLELRFLEPDADDSDEFGVCECGDDFCDGSLCLEPEHDGYEDGDVPELTDEDAPEEKPEPEWLPDAELADAPAILIVENAKVEVETANSHILQNRTAEPNDNKRLTEESSFTTQTLPTERRLSAPPDVGDEFSNEPEIATSTPSLDDVPGSNGSEEQVSTDPPETTAPMPAREAWALYERGEVTLMEVERLCRPRGKEREVAA